MNTFIQFLGVFVMILAIAATLTIVATTIGLLAMFVIPSAAIVLYIIFVMSR